MGAHPFFATSEFTTRMTAARAALAGAGAAVGLFDEYEAMARLTGYGNSENRRRLTHTPRRLLAGPET
jgi:hypothetical protein